MTYSEALKYCCGAFEENGIENAGNESRWLMESIDDSYMLKLRDEMDDDDAEEYMNLAERRICGEPLQYLTGSWEFYGREFYVGKGVLIPRPETELLVDYALEYLRGRENPVVIDLCSGTGCIALTVALERKDARVLAVEKYGEAFGYLERNIGKLRCGNVTAVRGDVFRYEELGLEDADLILSNPPYVESGECSSLQKEVLYEPVTALDGGEDGLDFYRQIALIARKHCRGAVAVECGENQAEEIGKMFSFPGELKFLEDFNGVRRVTVFERK